MSWARGAGDHVLKRYSVGFLFNQNGALVSLILKNRPEWQRGLWNGIGGHVEPGETHKDCMVREFAEETGVVVTTWNLFAEISARNYILTFYRAFDNKALGLIETVTDEPVKVQLVSQLPGNCVPNLPWLIHLALDRYIQAPTYFDGRMAP